MNGGDVGGGPLGEHHVLGDLDPHGAERLDARLGRIGGGGRWCGLREVGFHVLLGDTAAGAGACHLAEIEVVLAGQFAD